jgi:predicted O-methyltransferase YrrM
MQEKMKNSTPIESIETLKDRLNQEPNGVISIKPRVIFQIVEKNLSEMSGFSAPIPSSMIGSITTLEASIICSLLLLNKPLVIFEFGTFLGYTTSVLLLNTDKDSKVYSIDLPNSYIKEDKILENTDWTRIHSDDQYNDNFLTSLAFDKGEKYLKNFRKDPRLTLIKQDSQQFIPEELGLVNKTDFIFIDGGHTDAIVRSDTQKSLKMLSDGGTLIWHDYNSKVHPKVTEIVNNYSEHKITLHVENTLLAINLNSIYKFLG